MIDYEYQDLFLKSDVDKQILIEYDTGRLTNKDIHSEQFELRESLCSQDTLRFGACEASSVKFTVSNVFEPMKDKWITVSITLAKNDSNSFKFGRYKVYSDVPTADRKKREIMAYDALYDVINSDVAEWYNELLPNKKSKTTLLKFRNSFFDHFGIEESEIELPNDGITIEKTIEPEELSGSTVLNAICEINGCFGHIGRDGRFSYVILEPTTDAVYPSADTYPSEELYPAKVTGVSLPKGKYIPPCTYEDYATDPITGIVIRTEENDVGATVGSTENAYVIEDNFLTYGKDNASLINIAKNVYTATKHISYIPFSVKAVGNPCVEVGDVIRVSTSKRIIVSYVLERTLNGVQALRDSYNANGEKTLGNNVNSVAKSIVQIKGKTNVLTRTVEETISKLTDLDEKTTTELKQTAEAITAEAKRAKDEEASLKLTAEEIKTSVKNLDENLSSKITQNSETITAEVIRAKEAEAILSLTADEIKTSVKSLSEILEDDYYSKEETSSLISASADDILLAVYRNYASNDDLEAVESKIELMPQKILLSVEEESDGTKASIGIYLMQEDGSIIDSDSGMIELTGLVSFKNLENDGETTINGSNITTGSINADLITTGTLDAKAVTIKNLTVTWSDVEDIPPDLATTEDVGKEVTTQINNLGIWTKAIAVGGTQANAPFRVDDSGNLVATSATIEGEITATGGSIGDFTIGRVSSTGAWGLTGGGISLYPDYGISCEAGDANFWCAGSNVGLYLAGSRGGIYATGSTTYLYGKVDFDGLTSSTITYLKEALGLS